MKVYEIVFEGYYLGGKVIAAGENMDLILVAARKLISKIGLTEKKSKIIEVNLLFDTDDATTLAKLIDDGDY